MNTNEFYANSPTVLIEKGRPCGLFPHISGPQVITQGGSVVILAGSGDDTFLLIGEEKVELDMLARAHMKTDETGQIHIVGTRGRELCYLRIDANRKPESINLDTLADVCPAVGLDIAWTPESPLIVAPGPEPRTLALYSPANNTPPRVLARRMRAHPLLSYDANRKRLHLVFCGWNDYSNFYDVVYYMRSDDSGRTWTKADGTPIPVPFECGGSEPEPDVLSGRGQNTGAESNTLPHCLELDADGRPHVLYSFCRPYFIAMGPATTDPVEPRMRTKHICWDGNGWVASELSPDFEVDIAGGVLAIENSRRLHALVMFKQLDADWLDLGYMYTEDGGQTWQPILAVTEDAAQRYAHYVAPSIVKLEAKLHYVYTVCAESQESPVYAGAITLKRET